MSKAGRNTHFPILTRMLMTASLLRISRTEKPQDIILKDRYSELALDRMGKVLWTYKGNTGHYPWPYDFDNDGFDEIICGFDYWKAMEKSGQWIRAGMRLYMGWGYRSESIKRNRDSGR